MPNRRSSMRVEQLGRELPGGLGVGHVGQDRPTASGKGSDSLPSASPGQTNGTTRTPSFQTSTIRSFNVANANGSPSTTTRSARLPGSSVPSSSSEAHQLGGARRRGHQRLLRGEPVLGHVSQLVEVRPVGSHRTVGAHRDLHAGLGREPERVELRVTEAAELLADGLGHVRVLGELVGGVTGGERGDEPRAAFDHHRRAFLVQVRPVVDRADARPDRALDALRAVGVRHHPRPLVGGRPHDRVDLLLREVRLLRIVAGGEEASRRRDLDHVGPRPDHLADLADHAVHAVAHAARHAGILGAPDADRAAREPRVVVAAGHRQHRDADLHPRSGEHALFDRHLEAGVRRPSRRARS